MPISLGHDPGMTSASPMPSAFDPRIPFTRAEARAEGITVEMLLTRRYRKVLYDFYVASDIAVTPALRARAALKVAPPGSRISHHSAARLWGAAIPPDAAVHLTMPSAHGRLVRKGVTSHYALKAVGHTLIKGLPVSTPAQTFLELAAWGLELVDLVIVADSLIRKGRIGLEELRACAEEFQGRRCRVARRAAGLAREGVDSPMETRLRLLLVLAGLPEPVVNLIVRGANGEWQRRYDLAYEGLRLIVEYDGRQHATDSKQWVSDIHRREELDRMGWRLIVVTAEGIFADPAETLRRVRLALVDCGATKLRRTLKDEWRLHFPVA